MKDFLREPTERVPEDLDVAGRLVGDGCAGPPTCNLFLQTDIPLSRTLSISFVLQQGVGS